MRVHPGVSTSVCGPHRWLPGEFVECGVNAGFLSSAILQSLDWRNLRKKFYLVDTFAGPVVEQFSVEEVENGLPETPNASQESFERTVNSK
jgi:hypothetical protein